MTEYKCHSKPEKGQPVGWTLCEAVLCSQTVPRVARNMEDMVAAVGSRVMNI